MKVLKKGVMITVAGISAIGLLTGCTQQKITAKLTESVLFTDALNIIKDNNYFGIDGDFDLGIKMDASALSFNINTEGKFFVEGDVENELIHSKTDADINTFGLSQNLNVENYTLREDGKTIIYKAQSVTGQKDENWSYTITEAGDKPWKDLIEKIDLKNDDFKAGLEKAITDLTLERETKTIDNKECYVVSGIMQIDKETLETLTSGNASLSEVEALDIDSVWYFTKDSHELKRAELNPGSSVKNIKFMKNEVNCIPEKIKINMDFSFEKDLYISIPEDIKQNSKESVDSENAIDLMMQM